MTTVDIKAGQELFAYYGYRVHPMPFDYPWYWDLMRKIQKKERLQKSLKDTKFNAKCQKQVTTKIKQSKSKLSAINIIV